MRVELRAGYDGVGVTQCPGALTMAKQTTTCRAESMTSEASPKAPEPRRHEQPTGVKLSRAFIARLIDRHREALERLAKR